MWWLLGEILGPQRLATLFTTEPEPPRGGAIVSAGESRDIEEIYPAHAAAMYRVAVAVVRDPALAEDVVQESILKAWRNLEGFRGEASMRTWLLRITHHTAISMIRGRRDIVLDPADLPERPVVEAVDEVALDRIFRQLVEERLFGLDPISRAVVALREIEGMSYDEIALALDLPPAVVRTRLFRARRRLAQELEDWKEAS